MKDKNVFKRWEKRSLKHKIISGAIAAIVIFVGPLLLLAVFVMLITHSTFLEVWRSGLLWGLYAAAVLSIIILILFEIRTLGSKRVLKVNKDLEDSHFLSDREIAHNEGFTVTEFSKLKNVKDGLLINAEKKRRKMDIVLLNPIHAMLIATTGTGKTTTYVEPFIEILSRTETKPCMIITDPKGELYERHANSLKKNGYNVFVINLSMTYRSSLWNPFNDVWRKTDRISEEITQEKNKYRWGGKLYDTYAQAEQDKKEYTVRLSDEIYVDLQDLIYTACPVEGANDKSWQQGARDLLFAMALRMWEDVRDGYMPREKFNLYNLWWNLTEYAKNDCEVLKEYIDECSDEFSRAPGLANTVLVSEDRTLSSYLGSVNQYLHWMADGAVAQLTSGNEIEFSQWDEAPNVLFIKIPDAKEGRHGLVTLMLVQLYKALLDKAALNNELKETPDERLKRNCYFLMDEFGSLPKIHRFEKIVPIARSRKIFLVPVIQDYKQLDATYGSDGATIIRNNCNVKIFMGTNDDKTRAEISEACGKQKVKSVSYNENKDMGVSTSAQSVPLIYPSELKNLNNPDNGVFGNSVILVSGTLPIRGKTTPFFKAKDIYGADEDAEVPTKDFMIFNEKKNRYDITKFIFLHHNLDDNYVFNDPDKSENPKTQASDKENKSNDKKVASLTKEQIDGEIAELKGKISEQDYSSLILADDKIVLLNGLAERATKSGNLFLVIQIEKIISLIKYSKNISERGA